MIKKISLLTISIVITFIAAELVLRLLGEETQKIVKDDSDYIVYDSLVGYTYTKNLDVDVRKEDYSISVHTNSDGYRDDEWLISADDIKILVGGESICAGYGIDKQKRWSDVLAVKLNERKESIGYKVFNASVSGYNLIQIKKTIDILKKKIYPSMIIIGLNVESIDRLSDPYVYFRGYCIRQSKLDFARIYDGDLFIHIFSNRHVQFLEKYLLKYSVLYNFIITRAGRIKAYFISDYSAYDSEDINKVKSILSRMIKEYQQNNLQIIIVPIIQHDSNFEFPTSAVEVYFLIQSFCRENNLMFTDLLPVFEAEVRSKKSFWLKNDPHWNEVAHEIAADQVLEHFLKVESKESSDKN